ncbi:hypothetical protein DI392_00610 [Vibrio albus]|uniref:CHAD domain-containing protein n=1 Tax=Vibrio albus TaxID=2200953 RepID=A0A2U3BDE0_9VIBR|nr:CHAD domain-containing protein [Vibrio albus]PWI34819.1 hypothetical protein DI392_00610 [Vibrio albus]
MNMNLTYIPAGKVLVEPDTEDVSVVIQDGLSKFLLVASENAQLYVRHHNPEALHQYRVALRYSRALLKSNRNYIPSELFQFLKQCCKDLTEPTGRLRDLEVFGEHLKEYTEDLPEFFRDGARHMQSDLHWEANKYRQKILSWFLSNGFQSLLAEFSQNITNISITVPRDEYYQYQSNQIRKLHKKVSAMFSELDTLSVSQLHQLRIMVKNQRYIASFFPNLSGNIDIGSHKKIQTALGLIHDYAMQRDFAIEYIEQKQQDEKNLKAIALFTGGLISYLSFLEKEKVEQIKHHGL